MELAELHVFEPEIFEPVVFGVGDVSSIGNSAPCIKGHISGTDSSFTFQVNGSDVTVSVSGGNWKYKPTATITSIAFVGVPQLESLELDNIKGVSTFNLDYPVVPVFKKCDATTESALNYVYHIRGTATEDFDFTLKYIDGSNNVTEVTESAVIDGDGKWDVAYSGKTIKEMGETFYANTYLKTIEFTELLDNLTSTFANNHGAFQNSYVTKITFAKGTTLKNCTNIAKTFTCNYLKEIVNIDKMTFENVTNFYETFSKGIYETLSLDDATFAKVNNIYVSFGGSLLKTLNLPKATFAALPSSAQASLINSTALVNLNVPNSGTFAAPLNLKNSPLSYESMLKAAGWLKDLSGGTAQTITFKADTYNALTAEQQAALTAIIVTEKGWNLATA